MNFLYEPINFDSIPEDDKEILEGITISEIMHLDRDDLLNLTQNLNQKYLLYLLKHLDNKDDRLSVLWRLDTELCTGTAIDPEYGGSVSDFYAEYFPVVESNMLDDFLNCSESISERMKLLEKYINYLSSNNGALNFECSYYKSECGRLTQQVEENESIIRQQNRIIARTEKRMKRYASQGKDAQVAQAESASDTDEAYEAPPVEATIEEKVCKAVDRLYDEDLVKHKYYLAAVRQVLLERKLLPGIECTTFVEMLRKGCITTDRDDLPTADSVSKVIILDKYPKWRIRDKSRADSENMIKLTERFLQLI